MIGEHVTQQGRRRECCNEESNLVLVLQSRDKSRSVRTCRCCGARHFEVVADPLELKFTAGPSFGYGRWSMPVPGIGAPPTLIYSGRVLGRMVG